MAAVSIGFNPFFGNETKTAEPWLLAHFDEPFYGQEMRLLMARRCFVLRARLEAPANPAKTQIIQISGPDHPPSAV
jgi:hypothetical protein